MGALIFVLFILWRWEYIVDVLREMDEMETDDVLW